MKAGTKVWTTGAPAFGVPPESGRVLRWNRIYGERKDIPGYVPVRFDVDGGVLMVHESVLVAEAA